MASVRTRHTGPELAVRTALHRAGLRFRLHVRDLPGTPDIVLPKYRTVVNVHGCFWHQHAACPRAAMPKTNRAFWKKKLTRNVERDRDAKRALKRQGWSALEIWSCQIRDDKHLDRLARRIRTSLT